MLAAAGLALSAAGPAMAAAEGAGTSADYLPPWATSPARDVKGGKEGTPPAAPQQPGGSGKSDKAPAPAPAAQPQADTAPGEIMWSTGAKSRPAARANPAEMEVPLQEDKFRLGDVKIRLAGESDVSIGKERLVQIMTPLLRPEPAAALSAIPDNGGYIPLASLAAKGFNFRFDPGQVALFTDLTIEQRAKGKLSASTRREMVASENLSKPALFAAYMNVHAGVDYVDQSSYGATGMQNVRLDLQGAARWFNLVLEGEATLETDGGLSLARHSRNLRHAGRRRAHHRRRRHAADQRFPVGRADAGAVG